MSQSRRPAAANESDMDQVFDINGTLWYMDEHGRMNKIDDVPQPPSPTAAAAPQVVEVEVEPDIDLSASASAFESASVIELDDVDSDDNGNAATPARDHERPSEPYGFQGEDIPDARFRVDFDRLPRNHERRSRSPQAEHNSEPYGLRGDEIPDARHRVHRVPLPGQGARRRSASPSTARGEEDANVPDESPRPPSPSRPATSYAYGPLPERFSTRPPAAARESSTAYSYVPFSQRFSTRPSAATAPGASASRGVPPPRAPSPSPDQQQQQQQEPASASRGASPPQPQASSRRWRARRATDPGRPRPWHSTHARHTTSGASSPFESHRSPFAVEEDRLRREASYSPRGWKVYVDYVAHTKNKAPLFGLGFDYVRKHQPYVNLEASGKAYVNWFARIVLGVRAPFPTDRVETTPPKGQPQREWSSSAGLLDKWMRCNVDAIEQGRPVPHPLMARDFWPQHLESLQARLAGTNRFESFRDLWGPTARQQEDRRREAGRGQTRGRRSPSQPSSSSSGAPPPRAAPGPSASASAKQRKQTGATSGPGRPGGSAYTFRGVDCVAPDKVGDALGEHLQMKVDALRGVLTEDETKNLQNESMVGDLCELAFCMFGLGQTPDANATKTLSIRWKKYIKATHPDKSKVPKHVFEMINNLRSIARTCISRKTS